MMSPQPARGRIYKETTAQQLRSFYETARLGSFSAAARSLGLANPTVWQQVRALERELGERLVEPHRGGCRLTEGGQLLADLVGPLVSGMATLKRRFRETRAQVVPRLVLATTPRILAEDLPECVAEFRRRHPDARLNFREMSGAEVLACVESGESDVGLLHNKGPEFGQISSLLEVEPVYEVDIALVTPADHPLARRRNIRPSDLRGYPLVNGLQGMPDLSVTAVLDKAGVLLAQPHLVEATFTTTVLRYVETGFGIGLIFIPGPRIARPGLHEHIMSRHFGRTIIHQVRRKGSPPFKSASAFLEVVVARMRRAGAGPDPGPAGPPGR
jgi:molybdate transport repressor ModE-like protein